MALITSNTSASFSDSSIMTLLQTIQNDGSIQEDMASEKKERNYNSQISLQKDKIKKMQDQIKASFSSNLLRSLTGLIAKVGFTLIDFKLESLKAAGSEVFNSAFSKMLRVGSVLLDKGSQALLELDPYASKAKKIGVDIEKIQADAMIMGKMTDKASEQERKAQEFQNKNQDAMREFIRSENEARNATSKF